MSAADVLFPLVVWILCFLAAGILATLGLAFAFPDLIEMPRWPRLVWKHDEPHFKPDGDCLCFCRRCNKDNNCTCSECGCQL